MTPESSPEAIAAQRIILAGGDVLDLSGLELKLAEMKYERVFQIESPGQFAVRGGIIDVYPLTEELPVRIELWGDEIDSIRSFDVESQRSVENLDQVIIYPASENWKGDQETVSFLQYFPKDETVLFLCHLAMPSYLLKYIYEELSPKKMPIFAYSFKYIL